MTTYRKIFKVSVPKVFIVTTINVLYLNFIKFGRWEIDEILCYLPDKNCS